MWRPSSSPKVSRAWRHQAAIVSARSGVTAGSVNVYGLMKCVITRAG